MTSSLEYHIYVRFSIPASLARFTFPVLSLIFVSGTFVSPAYAQINGVPSSVTSPGFGGRAVNGTAPSVTSLGPRGFAPSHVTTAAPFIPFTGEKHHHHRVEYTPAPVIYPIAVPYAVDFGPNDEDNAADDSDANYQGGPTIFDRRGSGAASYIPPVRDVPTPHAARDTDDPADPEPPQLPTLLVFRDGHKLEVGNYAILGATLFDLTPGHPRKIALADLDLDATCQQNDDRGVAFQLPTSAQN